MKFWSMRLSRRRSHRSSCWPRAHLAVLLREILKYFNNNSVTRSTKPVLRFAVVLRQVLQRLLTLSSDSSLDHFAPRRELDFEWFWSPIRPVASLRQHDTAHRDKYLRISKNIHRYLNSILIGSWLDFIRPD